MEQKIKKTIGIVIMGESQTCKSSIIKLFQQYGSQVENSNVEIGEPHVGKSCTQKPETYIFVSQTGYKFIFIDIKGYNDNINLETNDSICVKLQEFLSKFTDVFIQHKVEQINFIITECISDSTSQFSRNLPKLYYLLGKNGYLSTMVLFTKYNPQLFTSCPFLQNQAEKRIESVKNDIKDFDKHSDFNYNMKTMKFHTQISDNSIPKLDKEFFVKQEQEFINIVNSLNSYPIQIFQEYAEYCSNRIEELHKTIGVGIFEYETQKIKYVEKEFTESFRTGQRRYLGLFGPRDKVWQKIKYKVPEIETIKQQIQLKTLDDIKRMFNNDTKYLQEKQEKLNSLFEKYTI